MFDAGGLTLLTAALEQGNAVASHDSQCCNALRPSPLCLLSKPQQMRPCWHACKGCAAAPLCCAPSSPKIRHCRLNEVTLLAPAFPPLPPPHPPLPPPAQFSLCTALSSLNLPTLLALCITVLLTIEHRKTCCCTVDVHTGSARPLTALKLQSSIMPLLLLPQTKASIDKLIASRGGSPGL